MAADNPEAAQSVVLGIYEKAQMLRHFPEIGQKYRSEKEGEIRVLLYGHYRIAYLERPVHVVSAYAGDGDIAIVVTVYQPAANRWIDFERRRKV
ncbi:MAG: type II toxin-antitoxin system RelE/ParE family toxin [Bacteroidetes bacterium]|nr:type II toxin-antitoxin system RelE/ParE family toxin [Bacteroidota bacterium]